MTKKRRVRNDRKGETVIDRSDSDEAIYKRIRQDTRKSNCADFRDTV